RLGQARVKKNKRSDQSYVRRHREYAGLPVSDSIFRAFAEKTEPEVFAIAYGSHPATKRACSSILARINKAASKVRRAACPSSFGVARVSTQSRKASSWSDSGSALAICSGAKLI